MAAIAAANPALPDDPALLKRLLAERDEHLRDRDRRIAELELANVRLEHELLVLRKRYYGPRADALATASDVAQLLLDFAAGLDARPVHPDDLPAGTPQADAQSVRRLRRGRRDLAAFGHLPVVRHEHDLPDDEKSCSCCGTLRQRIGTESSWQVEYVPGRFERVEHARFKYAFTTSRSRDGPARFHKDYDRVLAADAYGGYDGVVVGNAITRAGWDRHRDPHGRDAAAANGRGPAGMAITRAGTARRRTGAAGTTLRSPPRPCPSAWRP